MPQTVNYSNANTTVNGNVYAINSTRTTFAVPAGSDPRSVEDLLVVLSGVVQNSLAYTYPSSVLSYQGIDLYSAPANNDVLAITVFDATSGLVSLNEVKEYLTISSNTNDTVLSSLISKASDLVETYCGTKIRSADFIEYKNGGRRSVFVKNIPINSIYSVKEYDGNTYTTLNGPNADGSLPDNVGTSSSTLQFTWESDTGKIERLGGDSRIQLPLSIEAPSVFANYPKAVRVHYNGGYLSLPNDLKLAVFDIIKMYYKQSQEKSFTFQGESKDSFPLSSNFPPHIRRILDLYRVIM